jgi:uncharacterized protein YhaN
MRFQRLHIPAFGPFTNLELSFPSAKNDLHVIYGGNEAGKSSLLRAIRDLLFGIHIHTPDNFRHDHAKLRVLGEIENQGGERLVFQRRKGSKNTLLDKDGGPLLDSVLQPFLGGIDQSYFSAMFGLGGSELRDGAVELLAGKGEIGNALFSASLGGTPIQRVLDALIEESEQFFKGKATTKVSIRPAVNNYKELLKNSREAVVKAETWDKLENDLAQQDAAKSGLDDEIREIVHALAWIQRCEDALPSVGRLTDEMRSLSGLPTLPEVASDFLGRAKAVNTDVGESSDKVQRLTGQITQLENQLAKCATSPNVMAVANELDLLHEGLGAFREQKKNLIKLTTELAGIELILRAGMKTLEVEGEFESLEPLRLSSALQLSCEEAAKALQNALSNQFDNQTRVAGLKEDIENDQTELSSLPETDLTPLRESLAVAAEATEANKTLAGSQSAVEKLVRTVTDKQALVPGVPEDLDASAGLSVPASATIRKFRDLFDEFGRDMKSETEDIRVAQDTVQTLETELKRLERRGELPSEESLKQARQHRDHGWQLVLADWKGDGANEELDPASPLVEAFPRAIFRADNIADQLRLDAESVAQAEEKRLQIQNNQKRITVASERLVSLQDEMKKCQVSWKTEWAACGVPVRSPVEMEEWRENWVQFRETVSKLREAEAAVKSKHVQVRAARERLAAALMDSSEKPFSVLYDAAIKRVQQVEVSTGERNAIEKRVEKLKSNLASLDRKSEDLRFAVETTSSNWKIRCRTAALSEDTTPESGLKLLQERRELLAKFDHWKTRSAEAEITKSHIRQYEESVSKMAVSLGIDAELTEAREAGLWDVLSEARKTQAQYDQLTSQITDAETELSAAQREASIATEALKELLRLYKLEDPENLELLLTNLETRTTILDRIDSYKETLSGLARGQGLDEFIARVQAENADDLPQRKVQLETDKETKTADLQEVESRLRELNRQKRELEKAGDAAADFRQQSESVAATLKHDASRFIRLRLAAHFLRNQVERFREENQGPLMEKSGHIFRQLTRGAIDGLTVAYDDKDVPVMVGRRQDGATVAVERMSDGCRDQLYLSLRLAAMDRYLEEHEPMPLILDDLLITFDNERTRAILPQLANLATRSQVFLFTHHEHLIELCHETLGEGQFMLHKLASSTSSRPD